MKVFKKGNWKGGIVCPICGTNKQGQVVLMGIDRTEEYGLKEYNLSFLVSNGNIEAKQVHLDCLDLRLKRNKYNLTTLIYQLLRDEDVVEKQGEMRGKL